MRACTHQGLSTRCFAVDAIGGGGGGGGGHALGGEYFLLLVN